MEPKKADATHRQKKFVIACAVFGKNKPGGKSDEQNLWQYTEKACRQTENVRSRRGQGARQASSGISHRAPTDRVYP